MSFSDFSFLSKFLFILISSVGLWLVVLVYLQIKEEKLKLYFILMIVSLILNYDFAYFAFSSSEPTQIISLFRLSTSVSLLFPVSAYYFYNLYFLKEKGKNIILERVIVFLSLFFALANLFTDGVIKGVIIKSWGPELILGGLSPFLSVFVLVVGFYIVYSLVKSYFFLPRLKKSQVFYFLVGFLIYGSAQIIFNVLFPSLLGTVKYSFLGSYSVIFFFIFTAYAMIKRGLFGVKMILTALLVAFITVLLLVDTFLLTSDIYFQFFKTINIFIFIYFGYFLIKSITKEIKLKEQLQDLNNHLQDKVDEQIKEIKSAYEVEKKARIKLEELDKVKDEFISTAAHQLRTPLSATRWALRSFLDGTLGVLSLNEVQKNIIEKTYESNNNLINIVGDLLDTSNIRNESFIYNPQEENLSLLIKEVVSSAIFLMKNKKIKISYHEPEDDKTILKFDRNKLSMALRNIMTNAVDYTPDGGEIEVNFSKDMNQAIIEIKDTGIGISPKDRTHIFEKFYRGANAKKTETDRSGLGLYISKQIIEKHGGNITVESKEGEGTKVVVTLPM